MEIFLAGLYGVIFLGSIVGTGWFGAVVIFSDAVSSADVAYLALAVAGLCVSSVGLYRNKKAGAVAELLLTLLTSWVR